jgi:hypothetical protein
MKKRWRGAPVMGSYSAVRRSRAQSSHIRAVRDDVIFCIQAAAVCKGPCHTLPLFRNAHLDKCKLLTRRAGILSDNWQTPLIAENAHLNIVKPWRDIGGDM